jgi:hypothetical protein
MAVDVLVRKWEAANRRMSPAFAFDRHAPDHITWSGCSAPSDRWRKATAAGKPREKAAMDYLGSFAAMLDRGDGAASVLRPGQ